MALIWLTITTLVVCPTAQDYLSVLHLAKYPRCAIKHLQVYMLILIYAHITKQKRLSGMDSLFYLKISY